MGAVTVEAEIDVPAAGQAAATGEDRQGEQRQTENSALQQTCFGNSEFVF